MVDSSIDIISIGILLGEILIPIFIFGFVLVKLRKHIPVLRGKKSQFQYGMIDESRNKKYYTIDETELKVVGKFVMFEFNKEMYLVVKNTNYRYKDIPTADYALHNPVPLPIKHDDEVMSASELKEAQDSKVVFDLLRFTLSQVETGIMILLIINVIIGVIGLYFNYSSNASIGTQNNLLNQVIHYLFPNSAT